MPKTLLVIISGPPCTGKTTLGKWLAKELGLPFVYKDGIKELLFDTLGWRDREWSKELGGASYELLYYFVEAQLTAGRSHIVESNFYGQAPTERFLEFKSKYNVEPFQIQCKTEGETLWRRFQQRAESPERHPGHVENLQREDLRSQLLKGRYEPLEIGGKFFDVDTTDFGTIDYDGLLLAIESVTC